MEWGASRNRSRVGWLRHESSEVRRLAGDSDDAVELFGLVFRVVFGEGVEGLNVDAVECV